MHRATYICLSIEKSIKKNILQAINIVSSGWAWEKWKFLTYPLHIFALFYLFQWVNIILVIFKVFKNACTLFKMEP